MKKTIISLLLPILIGCTKKTEERTDFKLILNPAYHTNQSKSGITTFKCLSDQKLPTSVLKMKYINENLIEIICSNNTGYGGENITFHLNRDLNITDLKFDYASDNEGAKTEDYKIEKFKLTLSQDPFKGGIDRLQGEISIIGKIKVNPQSWFKPSFEEDFIYSSLIDCE